MSSAETFSMNRRLQDSLRGIEPALLRAVITGPESLRDFLSDWTDLQQQLIIGQKETLLNSETLSLAQSVALNVEVVGQSFLDVQKATSSVHVSFTSEWQRLLDVDLSQPRSSFTPGALTLASSRPQTHRIPKPSLQPTRYPTKTPITSTLAILPSRNTSGTASVTESSRSASDPTPLPEFIEHAYKFFVANIFNPYPTREEKEAIVDKTNNSRVTLSSISNWFTNARRRCGWAEILKRRCDANRDMMVDLATRVFIKPDPSHPVDPQIVQEMMEMKESVESMYERKTRTSAWINEIEEMEELVNPIPKVDRLAAKKRETEAEREARRRQKEMLKEQRDFERRKCKIQAEALRKADKVAKAQREQEKQEKNKQRDEPLFIMSYPPTEVDDNESVSEPRLVAGGKRKFDHDDGSSYDYSALRHVSPAYSLSSSFTSDLSSEGRVPSLTWSDSGDEQRPYKRIRSFSSTPYIDPSSLPSPLKVDVPPSFDYSFTFEPTHDLALGSFVDVSVNSNQTGTGVAAPPRGQKRRCDMEDGELTPNAKRPKPIVASSGPDLAPSIPLFTPTPSVTETLTSPASRRSSFAPVDLNEILGLDSTNPQLVQNPQPDASLPLEVTWTSPDHAISLLDTSGTEDLTEFGPFFQWFAEQQQPPTLPTSEASEHIEQRPDAQLEIPFCDLPTANFMPQHPTPSTNSQFEGAQNLDLSGFTGFMSEEALHDLGLEFPDATHSALPDLSQSTSISPAWTPIPATPSKISPTPAELAEKAMRKERKRRELENKKAELERERARLAELERELDDD